MIHIFILPLDDTDRKLYVKLKLVVVNPPPIGQTGWQISVQTTVCG